MMTTSKPDAGVTRHVTVEDLLRSPALELRVIAGSAGLGRRVSWAHVSELEDPTPWLLGSELIMTTGIGVPGQPSAQVRYLERLDNAGVAGLALSAKLHVPPLDHSFIEVAERRSFPILEVPLPVPFIAIAQAVAAAVQADIGQGLSAQLRVFGSLRWLTVEGLSAAEVVSRLESLSGFTFYLCDPDLRPLLIGVPAPPPNLADRIPLALDGPPTVLDGYILPVPTPGGPAGLLLAQRRPDVTSGDLAVVQHVATVAALLVSIARHEQETLRREGAEILAEMLGGVVDGATARRRLARSGFDPTGLLQLFAVRAGSSATEDVILDSRLTGSGIPHMLLRQRGQTLALLPDDPDVRGVVAALPDVVAGASRAFEGGGPLDLSRREALWAAARAGEAGGGLIQYGHDAAGRWLAEDGAALRALTTDVLGKVITYDRAHPTRLMATVRTWMERDRRSDEAARALGIHVNTLAYRLRRFELISGRDLAATSDLAEIWLALRASDEVGDT